MAALRLPSSTKRVESIADIVALKRDGRFEEKELRRGTGRPRRHWARNRKAWNGFLPPGTLQRPPGRSLGTRTRLFRNRSEGYTRFVRAIAGHQEMAVQGAVSFEVDAR